MHRLRLRIFVLALAFLAGGCSLAAAGDALEKGRVELVSVGALEFGPDNVLFVGDSEGAAVYAIDVGRVAGPGPSGTIEDIDGKIAALLGTTARDVFIKDMAVHPGSGVVFLSVVRGQGDAAIPVLLRVSGSGEIDELSLDDVAHQKLSLPHAPGKDDKLYRWSSRTFTVTDLEFIDGELYVTGLSNEEFASKLRRVPFPFEPEMSETSLEIYHGAHGAWETFAPIFSFIPYEIEDEEYLLAGYLCTPLVTFPMDEVKGEKKLRGKTIAELGWGNIPTDIVSYEAGGEQYVLVSNNRRGPMKMKGSDIAAANKGAGITSKAGPRTGVDYHSVPLGSVVQVDKLDDSRLVVLGRSLENGSLYLMVAPTDRL